MSQLIVPNGLQQSICELCGEYPQGYEQDLFCYNDKYAKICICEKCNYRWSDIAMSITIPKKSLHQIMLRAAINHVPKLITPGKCVFCDKEKAYDWQLKCNNQAYNVIDVCADCAEILYGEDIQCPQPDEQMHIAILKTFIDYARNTHKRKEYCEFGSCNNPKVNRYTLTTSWGEGYQEINLCHQHSTELYGVNLPTPQPIYKLHQAMLEAYLNYPRIIAVKNNCQFCDEPAIYSWELNSDGHPYADIQVCYQHARILHETNIQDPNFNMVRHIQILQAYIDYWEAELKKLTHCYICGGQKTDILDLRNYGRRYDMIPVCCSCKEKFDPNGLGHVNWDWPYPHRLIETGAYINLSDDLEGANQELKLKKSA